MYKKTQMAKLSPRLSESVERISSLVLSLEAHVNRLKTLNEKQQAEISRLEQRLSKFENEEPFNSSLFDVNLVEVLENQRDQIVRVKHHSVFEKCPIFYFTLLSVKNIVEIDDAA